MKTTLLFTLNLFCAIVFQTTGQVLSLDPTFGTNGKITNVYNETWCTVAAMAVQPDEKIIGFNAVGLSSSGGQIISRYNEDGSADISFGNNGVVASPIVDFNSEGFQYLLLSDGKILVGGGLMGDNGQFDFGIAKYNSDGTIDSSFGINGLVQSNLNETGEHTAAMAIQADNKILLLGSSNGAETTPGPAVVRYLPNGELDTTFGINGVVVIGNYSFPQDIVVLSDGKIIISAQYTPGIPEGVSTHFLIRLNNDGAIDTSYGSEGQNLTNFSESEYIPSIVATANDHIIATGTIETATEGTYNGVILKFDTNGDPDNSFGTLGRIEFDIPNPPTCGGEVLDHSFLQEEDGKIISVGNSCYKFLITRRNEDGTLDTQFDNDGIFIDTTTGGMARAYALQPDGKILIGGGSGASTIIRLNQGPLANDSFQNQQFSAYPNPFVHEITIDLNHLIAGDLNFDLIGIDGKIVQSYHGRFLPTHNNSVRLNVPETLSKGIYFVKISELTTGNTSIVKVLK